MFKNLLKREEGFTLIEIVVVMAIAAAILTIVFLAVSGAQKGRRDTERKAAASRVLAAAAASVASNGDYPTTCNTQMTAAASTCSTTADPSASAPDTVRYAQGLGCNAGATAFGSTASTKYGAVLYYSEANSATACLTDK